MATALSLSVLAIVVQPLYRLQVLSPVERLRLRGAKGLGEGCRAVLCVALEIRALHLASHDAFPIGVGHETRHQTFPESPHDDTHPSRYPIICFPAAGGEAYGAEAYGPLSGSFSFVFLHFSYPMMDHMLPLFQARRGPPKTQSTTQPNDPSAPSAVADLRGNA